MLKKKQEITDRLEIHRAEITSGKLIVFLQHEYHHCRGIDVVMFGVKQKNASCCRLFIDALRSEDVLDSADRAGLGNTQILTLATVVKHRLFSWSRFTPNLLTTFLRMLAEPFKSALITIPSAERYKPRLIRFPDAFHSGGFSPYLGRESPSRKLALDV